MDQVQHYDGAKGYVMYSIILMEIMSIFRILLLYDKLMTVFHCD